MANVGLISASRNSSYTEMTDPLKQWFLTFVSDVPSVHLFVYQVSLTVGMNTIIRNVPIIIVLLR